MDKRVKKLIGLLLFGLFVSGFVGITFSRFVLNESMFTYNYWIDMGSHLFFWIVVLYLFGYFRIKNLHKKGHYVKVILYSMAVVFVISLIVRYIENGTLAHWQSNCLKIGTLYLIIASTTYILRVAINNFTNKNVVIVGGSFSGRATAREILSNKSLKLNLKGYISSKSSEEMEVFDGDEVDENEKKVKTLIPHLGSEKELLKIIKKYNIQYIIVAKDKKMNKNLIYNISKAETLKAKVYYIDEMFELLSMKLPVLHLSKDYFYYIFRQIAKKENNKKTYNFLNRLLNIVISLVGIIITSPIIIISSIIIKLESKGPVFFNQTRVGKNEKEFTVYKFRSMRPHDPDNYSKYSCEDDPRITTYGKIMRKLRIDEIPQFFNILKGDMNLIGPRAEWDELVDKYEKKIPFYTQRHIIRPGVTGWAQVNYSYGSDVKDTIYKLQYDLYYVKNRSFLLDLLIFIKTIGIILTGKGM